MKSVRQRINEYVKYHNNGDCECNGVLLNEYCKKHELNNQQIFDLTYFFAVTYSVPSSIVLLNNKEQLLRDTENWISQNKKNLIFQSDRKYIAQADRFKRCIEFYKRQLLDFKGFCSKIEINGKVVLEKGIEEIKKWEQFGRFSAYLFLETYCLLMNKEFINSNTIDWVDGSTVTSGILNVFGLDKSADFFDKYKKLPEKVPVKSLDAMLKMLLNEIESSGGVANVTVVETSLCAYRKHYKGSRYNGYYLDRQLEEIKAFEKFDTELANELIMLRKQLFNHKYLGEVGGWSKIRKDLKKSYLQLGIII